MLQSINATLSKRLFYQTDDLARLHGLFCCLSPHQLMRKIESEMVAAVWNHHEWRKANTRVEIKGPHAMVFLHGNHIATLNRFDKCLEFYGGSDSRWFSRTTFSRLNALALQFCGVRPFYTKRHVPMISTRRGDREWTLRDFYSFNASGC